MRALTGLSRLPAFKASLRRCVVLCLAIACWVTASWAQSPSIDRSRAKAVAKACRTDIRQHCQDVQPGEGRIALCLQQNVDKLSQPCRDKLIEVLPQASTADEQ